MKNFIIKFLIFLTIIFSIIFLVSNLYLFKANKALNTSYLAAIIDKHARLDEIDSNRIVLVGGSNLVFGIDSKQMENELNKNVINLGLAIYLGFDFIINEAINSVKKGDIILLNLEYHFFYDKIKYVDEIYKIQKIYPKSNDYYQLYFKDKITAHFRNFRNFSFFNKNIVDSSFFRFGFNKYGDLKIKKTNIHKPYLAGSNDIFKNLNIDNHQIELLKELNNKCLEKNAKLFYLFPVYSKTTYNKNLKSIKDFDKELKSKINFIKIINSPETFVYDDKYFYDSVYHLTLEGRELRAKSLINILKINI